MRDRERDNSQRDLFLFRLDAYLHRSPGGSDQSAVYRNAHRRYRVQSEVTYTYKVVSIAPWTERPDVKRVFPDIRVTMADASKKNQVAGAQLTNKGWWIPGT